MQPMRTISHLTLILTLIVLGLFPGVLLGQEAGQYVEGSAGSSFFFRAWSRESGMPHGTVTDIARSQDGFLWLATFDGLARFDGQQFRSFDLTDGLVSNRMTSLLFDRRGQLWIGHEVEGLSRYAEGRFTAFSIKDGLPEGTIWALAEDSDGTLWVAAESGLVSLRPDESLFRFEASMPAAIVSLYVDRAGGLWVGDRLGLSYRAAGERTFLRIEGLAEQPVFAILEGANGEIWLATANGLLRSRPGAGPNRSVLDDSVLADSVPDQSEPWQLVIESTYSNEISRVPAGLIFDQSGSLWFRPYANMLLSSDSRIYRISSTELDAVQPAVEFFDIKGVPFTSSLLAMGQNGLWLGTFGRGLGVLTPRLIERFIPTEDFQASELRSILGDGKGGLWIGANCGTPLIHFRDGVFSKVPRDPSGHELSCIGGLARGANGDLWLGSVGDLVQWAADGSITRHTLIEMDSGLVIHAILEGRDGEIWAGLAGYGLARLEDGEVTFYTRADGLASDHVHFLAQARSGDLWIGTNRGLSQYKEGKFHTYSEADGMPRGMVRTIHEDRDGVLWIGSYGGGLARFEDGMFTRFTTKDGLYDNIVTHLLEDRRGNFWMLGNKGLSYIHRDQLNAYAAGELETLTSVFFDAADGMIEGSGGRQPAGWQMADGRMYFPTINGLAMVDPENFEIDPEPPSVSLDEVVIEGRTTIFDGAIIMAPGERDLEIHYAAPGSLAAERIRFTYRLEGYDEKWHHAGKRRTAYFTGLPAGSYTFRVKAANRHGVWNEDGAAVRLIVKAPWWRAGWAYLLYVFAGLALVFGYGHWQHRRIEKERATNRRLRQVDRMKDEILANTSHELRTPLYGMIGLAESLIEGAGGELPSVARSYLAAVVASGRRLGSLVNEILDFQKLRHEAPDLRRASVDLRAVCEVVVRLSSSLAATKNLRLENLVAAELPAAWAEEDKIQQILLNLIGNAIKFTEEGAVEISACHEADHLVVTVRDTGIGIAPEQQKQIFEAFEQADSSTERVFGGTGLGLAVTRQLIELHGGKLWVESALGEGSEFCFTLPLAPEGEPSGESLRESLPAPEVALAAPGISALSISMPQEPALNDLPMAEEPPDSAKNDAENGRIHDGTVSSGHSGIVLVVDDEPINREVLLAQLEVGGYRAEAVAGGVEALERVAVGDIDLVLLDVMMPRLSGYEVCRALRQESSAQELPVIFLTAKSRIEDRVAGLSEGGNDYLSKPVAMDELLARVETQLSLQAAHRRLAELLDERTEQLHRLGELLPICAGCKKVRDDEGYWEQMETFFSTRSNLRFSHGLCPNCAQDAMDELED